MLHDACGVGFIADLRQRSTRSMVDHGLTALRRLAHRGASPELGAVDGCGLLTAIPWPLVTAAFGGRLPAARTRALGMAFVDPCDSTAAVVAVERELRRAGATDIRWRDVPIDPTAVLPAQRASTPRVMQFVAGFDDGARAAAVKLYRARLRIERVARTANLRLTVVSLSSTTVVHKALVTPDALDRFYPDLADERFASPFVVVHQRFSTNTSADWALAQPFRTLAHNGEINTIGGNRLWMRARLADASTLPGFAGFDRLRQAALPPSRPGASASLAVARLRSLASGGGKGCATESDDRTDPISADGSDSRSLDDAVELMRHQGYSIAHALSRLVPPAWERERGLASDVRAFYEFQSLLSEPWDGPSALVFADGRYVGAALDRNGFRPARVVRTAGGLIAVASETGVLSSDAHDIVDRGRLGPGEMVIVDLHRGAVMGTNEIRRKLAYRRCYRQMVADVVRPLSATADLGGVRLPACAEGFGEARRSALRTRRRQTDQGPPKATDMGRSEDRPLHTSVGGGLQAVPTPTLEQRQAAFGCTREEIELLLKPMIAGGHEAVGSMGDDAPPAVLSSRSRLFTDFFRQRFAQVTNPPVDPYREASVMSLTTMLGAHGSFLDEVAPRPRRITLRSPVLTERQLAQLHVNEDVVPAVIETVFPAAGGVDAFERRLDEIVDAACGAVEQGRALVMLTDRGVSADRAPLPALLATAAIHHALVARGLRMRCSLVVESGDVRDAHQLAALCAYGASGVCPWLGYDTVDALESRDATGCDVVRARYRLALERGLLTVMSKMGVCTFTGYCGAQLFEILGIDAGVAERFFPGTASPVGGITLDEIAATAIERHARAFAQAQPRLEYPGLHTYRRDGEYHGNNPVVVRGLQRSRDEAVAHAVSPAYQTFTSHVYGRPPSAIRDLLELAPGESIPVSETESAASICRRFFASAMSVGALSPEAHRMVARAMNRLGARSNSGEGGEEPDRFALPDARLVTPQPPGGEGGDGSRTKQVASARFGVTPAYLRSADELQIKIAQGSKPGEGGQLPALKVVPHIARLRHAQPGTPLISPPVHHDIYSIEDLAQLIFDLRAFHPSARINVKLVASSGVGIIAAGVVKAGADAIQISGHDGGTGASPRASIKHAGMPWEIGLAEAHRALIGAGLRHRVVLQTDGGLKTGRDIAMAAALGAEEYGFGTAALVALGCVMARQCHANTCPVGIATQREDLRAHFAGTPEMLTGYLMLIANEVREILASLGLTRLGDLVGRGDLLRRRADVKTSLTLDGLLWDSGLGSRDSNPKANPEPRIPNPIADPSELLDTISPEHPLTVTGPIANTDRAFGARVAGAIAARYGDAGLPDGSVRMTMTGSAGQSFGAFSVPGMRLVLVGDANDGFGKGMHGGELVVAPAARERGRARQVLVGNAALYGATGGRVFIAGGAGERFAVRNSGATAVVEGAGDHACEYMTGGTVVILGGVGRNFASGLTGGVAYVLDRKRGLAARVNPQLVAVEGLAAPDRKPLRDLLETHERLTGSRLVRALLRSDPTLSGFVRVSPAVTPAADISSARAVNE